MHFCASIFTISNVAYSKDELPCKTVDVSLIFILLEGGAMSKLIQIWASCAIGIILIAFIGCGGKKVADSDLSRAAGKVVDNFSNELRNELYTAIEDSGVVWAVRICSEKGPLLSARYSSIPGWSVRRVSIRFRNPENAPDDFEREVLQILENRPANAGDEYFRWTEEGGKKTFRFLKAIKVKATCLNCHGPRDKFSADLRKVLDEKYPNDQAYDFGIDDYRGAYSVKITWPDGKVALDSIMAAKI